MMSDSAIEKCLRQTVRRAIQQKEEITVNIARARVEVELDLGEDFFKTSSDWKSRSKEVISSAFEEEEESFSAADKDSSPSQAGTKRPPSELKGRPQKKAKREAPDHVDISPASLQGKAPKAAQGLPVKRKNPAQPTSANGRATKKEISKTAVSDDDASDAEAANPSSEVNSERHDTASPAMPAKKRETTKTVPEGDESDMSSLIDEVPPPKKKRQKRGSSPGLEKNQQKPKSSIGVLSADEEQLKTLRSQLMKCGVKKLWHRELAGCETIKDKIRHLKGMLIDIGMTGRYSAEKAQQVKERRELAADMESAKEFQKSWGIGADTGRGHRSRSKKSLVVDDGSSEEDEPVVKAGAATGLVDFGGSGDDGSD